MSRSFRELYATPLPEHPAWISNGVLPKNGILLMGGPAKVGKTFLVLDLAHSLGTKEKLWGEFQVPETARVLYVELEVGDYEFQRRLQMRYQKLGVDPPPELMYLSKKEAREREIYLDTGTGVKELAREIEATESQVVIIDPIGRCMVGDENSNTEVGTVFRRLDELMAKHQDLSIVLVHHFGKPPKEKESEDYDPFSPYNFRGASKFFDAPDTLITFQRLPSQKSSEWWRVRMAAELRQYKNPNLMTLAVTEGGIIVPVRELTGEGKK